MQCSKRSLFNHGVGGRKVPSPRLRGEGSRAVPRTPTGECRTKRMRLIHSPALNHRAVLSPPRSLRRYRLRACAGRERNRAQIS